jgi:Mg2+/Co2+ transporter CorC
MSFWSAGAHCPIEGCHFAFGVESDDEAELDIIGAIVMEAHSQRSHDGAPVTVGSYQIAPKMQAIDEDEIEAGERPRLIN